MKFEGGRWTKLTRLERALPPSGRTGATYFRVMLALTIGVSSGTLHTGVALEMCKLGASETSGGEVILKSTDKGSGVMAIYVVEHEQRRWGRFIVLIPWLGYKVSG